MQNELINNMIQHLLDNATVNDDGAGNITIDFDDTSDNWNEKTNDYSDFMTRKGEMFVRALLNGESIDGKKYDIKDINNNDLTDKIKSMKNSLVQHEDKGNIATNIDQINGPVALNALKKQFIQNRMHDLLKQSHSSKFIGPLSSIVSASTNQPRIVNMLTAIRDDVSALFSSEPNEYPTNVATDVVLDNAKKFKKSLNDEAGELLLKKIGNPTRYPIFDILVFDESNESLEKSWIMKDVKEAISSLMVKTSNLIDHLTTKITEQEKKMNTMMLVSKNKMPNLFGLNEDEKRELLLEEIQKRDMLIEYQEKEYQKLSDANAHIQTQMNESKTNEQEANDKLTKAEEKIQEYIEVVKEITDENVSLKVDNEALKKQVTELTKNNKELAEEVFNVNAKLYDALQSQSQSNKPKAKKRATSPTVFALKNTIKQLSAKVKALELEKKNNNVNNKQQVSESQQKNGELKKQVASVSEDDEQILMTGRDAYMKQLKYLNFGSQKKEVTLNEYKKIRHNLPRDQPQFIQKSTIANIFTENLLSEEDFEDDLKRESALRLYIESGESDFNRKVEEVLTNLNRKVEEGEQNTLEVARLREENKTYDKITSGYKLELEKEREKLTETEAAKTAKEVELTNAKKEHDEYILEKKKKMIKFLKEHRLTVNKIDAGKAKAEVASDKHTFEQLYQAIEIGFTKQKKELETEREKNPKKVELLKSIILLNNYNVDWRKKSVWSEDDQARFEEAFGRKAFKLFYDGFEFVDRKYTYNANQQLLNAIRTKCLDEETKCQEAYSDGCKDFADIAELIDEMNLDKRYFWPNKNWWYNFKYNRQSR